MLLSLCVYVCANVSFEWCTVCAAVVYLSGNANMWEWWLCFSENGELTGNVKWFVLRLLILHWIELNKRPPRRKKIGRQFTLIFGWKFSIKSNQLHRKPLCLIFVKYSNPFLYRYAHRSARLGSIQSQRIFRKTNNDDDDRAFTRTIE